MVAGVIRRLIPLAVLAALAGCGISSVTSPLPGATATGAPRITVPVPTPPAPAGLKQVHDPGHVTGTIAGPCRARGQLPDPRCTPGAIDPAINQEHIHATICMRGWTAGIRPPENETSAFRRLAYAAYGLPRGTVSELDHLIPLELGGANDAANLWPEAGRVPNSKDRAESTLRIAVCSGKVTLAAAQDAIAADWLTAEHVLGLAG